MDDRSFDALTRALGGASTRRGALAAVAGIATGLGLAGRETGAKKKRKTCDPQCAAGQTCAQGTCACDNGGALCGAACCTGRDVCENGACVTPPRQCIPAGERCKGVGRRCCDGRACASGQGGQADVGCYVPAGGACETTAECVFDSTCKDGVCVANPRPTPAPEPPRCTPTFPVTADAGANGKALQDAVVAAKSGETIVLAPGDYRFDTAMENACLQVSGKSIAIERCTSDAIVNLVCPSATQARAILAYTLAGATTATELSLKGVTVKSENTTDPSEGIRVFGAKGVLEDVSIMMSSPKGAAVVCRALSGNRPGSMVIKPGVTLANSASPESGFAALTSWAPSSTASTISCEVAPTILPNYPSTNVGEKRCRRIVDGTIADSCNCAD